MDSAALTTGSSFNSQDREGTVTIWRNSLVPQPGRGSPAKPTGTHIPRNATGTLGTQALLDHSVRATRPPRIVLGGRTPLGHAINGQDSDSCGRPPGMHRMHGASPGRFHRAESTYLSSRVIEAFLGSLAPCIVSTSLSILRIIEGFRPQFCMSILQKINA